MGTLKLSRGFDTTYIVVSNPSDANFDLDAFYIQMQEIAAPATPPADNLRLYAKDKSAVTELFYKNSAGTERDLSALGVSYPLTPDKNARGNVTGTVTIDLSLATAHIQTMILTGNITFVFSNPPASTKNIQFQLDISQDATGGRTITWPASVTVTPTINSGPSERTVILCQTSDGGTTYDAFNTSSSASVLNAANKTLSNLDTPTAVNQDLLPASTLVTNLGSTSFRWNQLHIGEVRFASTGTLDVTIPEITTNTGNLRLGVATAKLLEMLINGTLEYEFSATNLNLKSNTVSGLGATITGDTVTNILRQDTNGWSIEVGTGDTIDMSVNSLVLFTVTGIQNESLKPMVFSNQGSYTNPASGKSMLVARADTNTSQMSELWSVNDIGSLDMISGRSTWAYRKPLQISPHVKTLQDVTGIWPVVLNANGDTWFTGASDATNGMSRTMRTVATTGFDAGVNDSGFSSTARRQDPDITIKFTVISTTLRRVWIGWFANTPMASDTNTTVKHFGLRLSTSAGSTQFVISRSNGTTQAETNLAVSDTAIHTIRLIADNINARWGYSFDGAAVSWITTNIPTDDELLGINFQIRTLENALKDLGWWWTEGSATK